MNTDYASVYVLLTEGRFVGVYPSFAAVDAFLRDCQEPPKWRFMNGAQKRFWTDGKHAVYSDVIRVSELTDLANKHEYTPVDPDANGLFNIPIVTAE